MTLELYGIVRARHPGLRADGPSHVITWEDLAMVAGEASDDPDPAAHFAAVCALVEQGPVLPLRFGTFAANEDVVRSDILAPAAPRLREDLDRFDGLAEVHVSLKFPVREPGWQTAHAADLLSAVSARALDSLRLSTGENADERWAFLVALSDLAAVRAAVDDVGHGHHVRPEWTGPLPAYSFLARRTAGETWTSSRWGW